MMRHYPDLSSASDWSCCIGNLIQPIRSTTQIWVVTHHHYGISGLVSQTSFGGENSNDVTKCRLFSQATLMCLQSTFQHIQDTFEMAMCNLYLLFITILTDKPPH